MKQYTTPDQTAKLIELGFEKPKNERWVLNIAKRLDYSIGELIEIMGYDLYSIHYKGLTWVVKSERIETRKLELIDALYDMILKLKEKGVI